MKKITTATGRRTGKVQEQQRLTIGLDVGDRSSFYCVLNGAGEVILQAKVATRPEALKEAFGTLRSGTRPLTTRYLRTVPPHESP